MSVVTPEAVLAALRRLSAESGYPPTVRELGQALGFTSSAAVYRYLNRLRDAGVVEWDPAKSRTLREVVHG